MIRITQSVKVDATMLGSLNVIFTQIDDNTLYIYYIYIIFLLQNKFAYYTFSNFNRCIEFDLHGYGWNYSEYT